MLHLLPRSRGLLGACALVDGEEGVAKDRTVAVLALVGTFGDRVIPQGFAVFVESADALAPIQTC